jgi:hypothetical protein
VVYKFSEPSLVTPFELLSRCQVAEGGLRGCFETREPAAKEVQWDRFRLNPG